MRTLVLAFAVGALIIPTAPAASAVEVGAPPALVQLGTLGGDESYPVAVNDRGQVVGVSETADGEFHAFFWDDGVMIDLAPDYASSAASDINNKGQVVFQRAPAGGPVESVLWSPTATISLGIVNARFVNEKGQVAGTVLTLDDPAGPNTNPFLWDSGVRTDMGPIPNWGTDSRVVDLNDKGAVLGTGLGPESFELGFVWSGGVITPVGDPTAFGGNGVVDINNRGQVLGADFTTGAFLWESGVTTYLGSVPGRGPSEPAALNERGWVAGTSLIEGGDERGVPVARRCVHDRGPGRHREPFGRHQRQGPGHRHVLGNRRRRALSECVPVAEGRAVRPRRGPGWRGQCRGDFGEGPHHRHGCGCLGGDPGRDVDDRVAETPAQLAELRSVR